MSGESLARNGAMNPAATQWLNLGNKAPQETPKEIS